STVPRFLHRRSRHRRGGPSRPGHVRVRQSPGVPSIAVLSAGSRSTPWYEPLTHAWPSTVPDHFDTPSTSSLPVATSASTMRAQDTTAGGCTMGVTLAQARQVIDAAESKAGEIGQPMNIAVVDAWANLVSHVRMDG